MGEGDLRVTFVFKKSIKIFKNILHFFVNNEELVSHKKVILETISNNESGLSV